MNSLALALLSDVESSKGRFRKETSFKLNICAAVQNKEESIYLYLSQIHNFVGKLIPNPDIFH